MKIRLPMFASARRVFFPGALACAALLLLAAASGGAQAQEANCNNLGGNPAANGQICSGVDAADTFCVIDSTDAFPCRGLFEHVRQCNDTFHRPALNPFLCGAACGSNTTARGKACGLWFRDIFLINDNENRGEPNGFRHGSDTFNVVYHGERRGLHYAYFPVALGNDGFTRGAHDGDYCDGIGNVGEESRWRPPVLAEAIALISDMESGEEAGRYVGDDNSSSEPGSDDSVLRDVFPVSVPPCADFSESLTEGDAAACADVAPLNPDYPVAVDLTIASYGEPEPALLTPAGDQRFAFFSYDDHSPTDLIIPCVLPADEGYSPPPNPVEMVVIPSGRFSSFPGVDPTPESALTLAYFSYAAPDAEELQREDLLFTVTVLARRFAGRNAYESVASISVSVSVRVGLGEFSYEDEVDDNGEIQIPVRAGTVIAPSPPFFLTIAVLAMPEFGPEKRAEFLFANIPVAPTREDVTVRADGDFRATLALPPEMAEEPDTGDFSIVATAGVIDSNTSFRMDAANAAALVRSGAVPTAEDGESVLVEFTHPRMRGALTLTVYFHPPPSSSARAAHSRGIPVAFGGVFSAPNALFPPPLLSGWSKRRDFSRDFSGEVAGGLRPTQGGSGIPAAFRECCR